MLKPEDTPATLEEGEVLTAVRTLRQLRRLALDESMLAIAAGRLITIARRGFTRQPLPYPQSDIEPQTAIRWLEKHKGA